MGSPSRSGAAPHIMTMLVLVVVAVCAAAAASHPTTAMNAERTSKCVESRVPASDRSAADARVSPDEVDRLLREGRMLIVDVRDSEEYRRAHLPQAVSIPLDALEERLATIRDAGQRVVTYCGSPECDRSARAAAVLRRLGITQAQALEGGFPAWVASGRVVVVPPSS